MMPRKRQSIHPDQMPAEDRMEEVALKCKICTDFYLIRNDQSQTKLSGESLKKWRDLTEKKTGVYPDLTRDAPFCCEICEKNPSNQASAPGTGFFSSNAIPLLLLGLAVLIMVIGTCITYEEEIEVFFKKEKSFKVNMHKQSAEETRFEDELYSLDKQYGRQEEKVWYTLAAGIKSVMKTRPNQPSVFLMLFDSESAGKTAKCLAQDVSKAATKYLMRREKSPLVISGADLDKHRLLEDPGLLLVDYNNTVRDKGVMIITNLQDVPPKVATSLHFFCDSYSPLVEKAVYFFTLKMETLPSLRLQKKAEDRLNELWSKSMDGSQLQPLITRMTPNVLKILSDSSDC